MYRSPAARTLLLANESTNAAWDMWHSPAKEPQQEQSFDRISREYGDVGEWDAGSVQVFEALHPVVPSLRL
jgi:hypothetical protein